MSREPRGLTQVSASSDALGSLSAGTALGTESIAFDLARAAFFASQADLLSLSRRSRLALPICPDRYLWANGFLNSRRVEWLLQRGRRGVLR